jgi:hypothetical protein
MPKKDILNRVQNSSRLPAIAGSFSTFAGGFVIEKKGEKNDSDQRITTINLTVVLPSKRSRFM